MQLSGTPEVAGLVSDVACSLDISSLLLLKVLGEPAATTCTVMHAAWLLFLMAKDPSEPTDRPPLQCSAKLVPETQTDRQ